MSWKRILGGGLVAGLVLGAGEIAAEPLLGAQMEEMFGRLGLPVPGEPAMLARLAAGFVLGIATVWLYAAIRPRYGAGRGTALRAGAAAWLLSCLLPNAVLVAFAIYPAEVFWAVSIASLVVSLLAALAGAAIYREEGTEAGELAAARA